MKLINRLFFISSCFLYTMTTYGQIHVDTISVEYYNSFTMQNQFMEELNIINESNEDYLTWVSPNSILEKTEQTMIQEYFYSRKGDFSFLNIMAENLLLNTKKSIGESFIKKIKPGDSFSYIILKSNKESSFYKDRIVIISLNKVYYYLHGFVINEQYYFAGPHVLLVEGMD